MAMVGGPYRSGAQSNVNNTSSVGMMATPRNESSADSLVAMLPPHVGLQRGTGGLEDGAALLHSASGQKRPFYAAAYDGPTVEDGPELEGDLEGGEDCSPGGSSQLEKKRRLTFDQVRSLEKNFEMENKLEPERKMQLAKELGLRPRQVAVWFQNRRARWKTKQLERDYEVLAQDYKRLKADYDQVLGEKNNLRAELQRLSGESTPGDVTHDGDSSPQPGSQSANSGPGFARVRSSPTVDVSLASNAKADTNRENSSGSSNSSDILDAGSPRTTDSSSLSPTSDRNGDSPFLDASFPPECSFVVPEVNDAAAAIDLDDPSTATNSVFHEDNPCNYLLLQLDDQSGVLPWWDWP